MQEKYKNVLFHGSKKGLEEIKFNGSRDKCDFGTGFYLGETYNQALSFICEFENSSIYSFKFDLSDLKVYKFETDLNWMLALCYYRGTLKEYSNHPIVKELINRGYEFSTLSTDSPTIHAKIKN